MTSAAPPAEAQPLYARLEEQIIGRDQRATSDVFYDLVRAGRPLTEMLRETIRIASPYIHVPYHQRIDNGVVRFVNNDHCLLSARAALQLRRLVGKGYELVPMAQTMWYVPTGLDPWISFSGISRDTTRESGSSRASRSPRPRATSRSRSRSISTGRSRIG